MASENSNQRAIWLDSSMRFLSLLFRLNTGKAWVSGLGPKGVKRLADGSVLIAAARPIPLGFATPDGQPVVGAADLNGLTSVLITPEMVGRTIAVYTAIETKRSKGGVVSVEQGNFIEQVRKAGGIAGVAASVEESREIFVQWRCVNKGGLM